MCRTLIESLQSPLNNEYRPQTAANAAFLPAWSNDNNDNNKFYLKTDNITEAFPADCKAIRGGSMSAKYEIKTKAN